MFLPIGYDASELVRRLDGIDCQLRILKGIVMEGTDNILREVQETKDQMEVVKAKLLELAGVVAPLIAAVNAAREALAAAQTRIAELEAADTELQARLGAAAAELDNAQQGVQGVIDSLPPAP